MKAQDVQGAREVSCNRAEIMCNRNVQRACRGPHASEGAPPTTNLRIPIVRRSRLLLAAGGHNPRVHQELVVEALVQACSNPPSSLVRLPGPPSTATQSDKGGDESVA